MKLDVVPALTFLGGAALGYLIPKTTAVPPDHQGILSKLSAYVLIEEIKYTLAVHPVSSHYEPNGNDKTVAFLGAKDFPEGVVAVNTWKTVPVGEFGRHSIEVSRLGWGELHIEYDNVSFSFPEITDTAGIKPGYWGMPIY